MQTFYNQAILSHNNVVRTSNIVTGIIASPITVEKNATKASYTHGDEITYVVSIVNSDSTALTAVKVSDDLGAYSFGGSTVIPLEYVENSVLYYVNGILQSTPSVTTNQGLEIGGIFIPAGGNAIIIYTVTVDSYAPLGDVASITNTATISGDTIIDPISVTNTIFASIAADLAISKSLSPAVIYNNRELTYTLTLQNYGASAVVATEDAVVTDTFNPILNNLLVSFNDTPWALSVNYTYDNSTGAFATLPGSITVPGAIYSQDPGTGLWTVTPGISVITVSGTI